MIKYVIGICILLFVGLAGGNIIWTALEIAIAYSLVEWIQNGGPKPPRGT